MDNQQGSFYEKEIWKIYPEFPRYEVSNLGNIRNYETKEAKYTLVHSTGYVFVTFKKEGKRCTRKMHRIVAELFLDPPSQDLLDLCGDTYNGTVAVKHLNNIKTDNRAENLQWDWNKNNTKEAWKDGLIPKPIGSKNPRAKLTEHQVHEICKAFEEGMLPSEAVKVFGISRQQATKIRAGFAWKHISCLYNIEVNRRKTFNDQSKDVGSSDPKWEASVEDEDMVCSV